MTEAQMYRKMERLVREAVLVLDDHAPAHDRTADLLERRIDELANDLKAYADHAKTGTV